MLLLDMPKGEKLCKKCSEVVMAAAKKCKKCKTPIIKPGIQARMEAERKRGEEMRRDPKRRKRGHAMEQFMLSAARLSGFGIEISFFAYAERKVQVWSSHLDNERIKKLALVANGLAGLPASNTDYEMLCKIGEGGRETEEYRGETGEIGRETGEGGGVTDEDGGETDQGGGVTDEDGGEAEEGRGETGEGGGETDEDRGEVTEEDIENMIRSSTSENNESEDDSKKVEEEETFNVEAILKERINKKRGISEWLVQWEDEGSKRWKPTWEPLSNIYDTCKFAEYMLKKKK